ncbi:MAG: UDP-3-O-(3-hydroxymyristoyl)glucosamine N-acyltransferase [Candidatus Omnitrophota bacterium]
MAIQNITIDIIAKLIEGTVEGDGAVKISGLSGVESAKPGDLTFATDEKKLDIAEASGASCVLTGFDVRKSSAKTLVRVKNPKLGFLMLFNKFNPPESRPAFIHPAAVIEPSVKMGNKVWVGPCVVIDRDVTIGDHVIIEANSVVKKGCTIGNRCRIHPNVTLYEKTVLKENVILHSGVVVGSDGFGYVKERGTVYKFPQLGNVVIEKNVEIGSNTTIDRGAMGSTVIGEGSKIDNLCQIAHNVRIGKNALIAALCGIAGSTVIKDDFIMGGQAGVGDNLKIGGKVTLSAQGGIIGDVGDNAVMGGFPARPASQAMRQFAAISWLAKNIKKVRALVRNAK